ncbi:MAG: serine/threonine-protein kinase [Cyanobacteria bacterium J06598_3]
MKRYDQTDEMIGHLIGPVMDPAAVRYDNLSAGESPNSDPESTSLPAATQPYRLVSLLGKQPGRRTFLAVDTRTQANVVVKLLLFGPDFTWEDLKLFEREAETLKSLDHPAIPDYLDSFESDTLLGDGFVLVQTYIEAKSLQAWVAGGRRFDEADLVAIAQSLLNILKYLHSRHPTVVHRDIKPSNILLTDRSGHSPGEIHLIDFGSVQLTNHSGTMTVVGTYGYMPPEQFGGRAFPASDLYSLGATLIYMATGQHPAELMQNGLQLEFRDQTTLRGPFAHWIDQLTQPDLSKRIQSTEQALEMLAQSQKPPQPSIVSSPQAIAQRPETAQPSAIAQLSETLPQQTTTHGKLLAPSDGTLSTRRDLKVLSTPTEFNIYFAPTRVGSPILIEMLNSGVLTLIFLIIALAIHWSVCAILLLALGYSYANKPKQSFSETAVLKLRSNPNATLSMRLIPDEKQALNPIGWSHLEKIELEAPFATSKFNSRLMFIFNKNTSGNRNKIRIDGSRREIKWLQDRLAEWNNVSAHD